MDTSHTATIGRSHRGLTESMPPTIVQPPSPTDSASEDIDSETAMNTVYNLLNELGDLNRSNRHMAERLAEKFNTLQARPDKEQLLEEENRELRKNVEVLVGAIREQQGMAKEYEATLARSLEAFRAVAFERHEEISDVQQKYTELLRQERTLNERLRDENVVLRGKLKEAAAAIRLSLADAD
ncbi:hypothetical protein GGI25_005115 [Coemansia spiralis]|uniref:Uncharacterized protein n=2 Tax=Coemansia TaxID=4863 RepID=A0A9W8G2U6_9FUNG|nr:hypothetical protein EDC05_005527 [Coemansia umbellata]KAJ2619979.1 hypothetical protein GGI26_005377 [Coemansia sp. RSA 1358]KAJ2672406.1 hypothetical protein GGI25_005115 [Coemansia spiralis]